MANLDTEIAVAKIGKYATRESGDTVEVVERPHGGISIVIVDGQRSGRSAKTISNLVTRKAISLLAEGVRDGAVARATHDYLRTYRGGKVSAELIIVSIDLATETLVVSRNSRCPVVCLRNGDLEWLASEANAVGIYRNTKPVISELPLQSGITVIVATDGVWHAGSYSGKKMDLAAIVAEVDGSRPHTAADLANAILDEALRLDDGRPRDDATVVVVKITEQTVPSEIRRMQIMFPIKL